MSDTPRTDEAMEVNQSGVLGEEMKEYKVTFDNNMKKINERISYKDGEMSIQASAFHYCYPKKDEGPYELYEVAVFDKAGKRTKEASFEHFADDSYSDEPVYACVPEALISEALKEDGYFQDSIDGIFERI